MKMPNKIKEKLFNEDFRRMDLMLKVFKRIGPHERRWFIDRLTSDHFDLITIETIDKARATK